MAGAADARGDAPKRLEARKTRICRRKRHITQERARLRHHARALDAHVAVILAEQHHHAADAAVAHEQVGAVAHHRHGNPGDGAHIKRTNHAFDGPRFNDHIGRPADLECRMRAHGLRDEHRVLARRRA